MAKSRRRKKSNVGAVVGVIIAFMLAAAIVIACGIGSKGEDGKWFANADIKTWFNEWGKGESKPDENEENDNKPASGDIEYVGKDGNALKVNVMRANFMMVASSSIPTAYYDAYGVQPNADNAVTISVTIKPETAVNKKVTGSLAWANPSSEWAQGKNVTNYVTAENVNGGTSFVVSCLQAFGEQILLTITSESNPDVHAECTIDYMPKLNGLSFTLGGVDITDEDEPVSVMGEHFLEVAVPHSIGTLPFESSIRLIYVCAGDGCGYYAGQCEGVYLDDYNNSLIDMWEIYDELCSGSGYYFFEMLVNDPSINENILKFVVELENGTTYEYQHAVDLSGVFSMSLDRDHIIF